MSKARQATVIGSAGNVNGELMLMIESGKRCACIMAANIGPDLAAHIAWTTPRRALREFTSLRSDKHVHLNGQRIGETIAL